MTEVEIRMSRVKVNSNGDAHWLGEFMGRLGVEQQRVAHVVGVNQGRVHEWLQGERIMPAEVKASLLRWDADGRPGFQYWVK